MDIVPVEIDDTPKTEGLPPRAVSSLGTNPKAKGKSGPNRRRSGKSGITDLTGSGEENGRDRVKSEESVHVPGPAQYEGRGASREEERLDGPAESGTEVKLAATRGNMEKYRGLSRREGFIPARGHL